MYLLKEGVLLLAFFTRFVTGTEVMDNPDSLIHLIYESACSGDFQVILTKLCTPLNSNKSLIALFNKVHQHAPLYQLAVGERKPNVKLDLSWLVNKHASTIELDPLYLPSTRQREGVIFDDRLVDSERLLNSDYFNEVYAPADTRYVLGVNLINNSSLSGFLAFNRGNAQNPFSKHDFELVERWIPHLRRALLIQLQLGEHKQSADFYQSIMHQSSYALALLNLSGQVVFMNTKFEVLLSGFNVLQCVHGRIFSSNTSLNSKLQSALRDAMTVLSVSGTLTCPKTIVTPYLEQLPGLNIEISPFISHESESSPVPFKGIIVAAKISQQTNAERAQHMFLLSPAETRLVADLLEGLSLVDIADKNYVSISTIRSHLKSVLKKTQTHSQTQLVLLVSQLSVF